ncbi:MAG: hypothetical protein ABH852_00790 [Methanobacteriota archaeon]
MREEYWHYAFWLIVVGSWAFGVVYGKWGGGYGSFFSDLGQAVSVPRPSQLELWQPIMYFTLTVVASFVLSQLFFGVGAAIFLFARGVSDSGLITSMEIMIGNWKLTSVSPAEIWTVFYIMLVLAVNAPLCLWAAQIGTQRAIRMLYRLRGKPIKSLSNVQPISNILIIIAVSLAVGLTATFALAHT